MLTIILYKLVIKELSHLYYLLLLKEDMSGERDSECERNTGWVRVSSRRQKKTRVLREGPSLKAAGNTNGYGRSYRRGNWREDRKGQVTPTQN